MHDRLDQSDIASKGGKARARLLTPEQRAEIARHAATVRESATSAAREAEQRVATLRDALLEQTQRLESALTSAGETSQHLEQHSAQIENVQQQALTGFQAQIENQFSPQREEMQRRSQEFAAKMAKAAAAGKK